MPAVVISFAGLAERFSQGIGSSGFGIVELGCLLPSWAMTVAFASLSRL